MKGCFCLLFSLKLWLIVFFLCSLDICNGTSIVRCFDQRYYVVLIVKKRMCLEGTCDLRHVFTTRQVIAAAIVVVSCRTWISRGLSQTPKMAGISNAVLVQSIRSKLILIYFHQKLLILCLYENINCITVSITSFSVWETFQIVSISCRTPRLNWTRDWLEFYCLLLKLNRKCSRLLSSSSSIVTGKIF